MLSQHIITEPIFEALFEGYSFVKNNAVSLSMQKMLDLLKAQGLWRNMEELQKFYDDVKHNIGQLDNAAAKQTVIVRLYNNFFKLAFPKMVEKLGIVYTPVEVVDFIIHSVDDVLKKEFGRSLTDENVNILDPFTGTGTFITRLIQSGLIKKEDLKRKYEKEIYANEIVLLAYYIAAVNIENAYHDAIGSGKYESFDGICLTDTFQLGETDEKNALFTEMFKQNSERVERQRKTPITVIMGNPPYSIGQGSANDNAQNQRYPRLEKQIEETYVKESNASLSKGTYDSYIKAFRWSTDRLNKNGGIICFVSNGAWIDNNAMDGFRKCLEKDFSSIYVFNLRGNQRTSGELSRKEGGKIFGSGSRTPIAVTLLVKNPRNRTEKSIIQYYDIGDYLDREQKLAIVKKFDSITNIDWKVLLPNEHGDWINQRNDIFNTLIPLAPEKKFDIKSQTFFTTLAIGVASNRDAWSYNYSKQAVTSNMQQMIEFYNEQQTAYAKAKKKNTSLTIEDFIDTDTTKISWTRALRNNASKNISYEFDGSFMLKGLYRPYCKQNLYYDLAFIESPGIWKQLFPTPSYKNLVIGVSGIGSNKYFSTLIADTIPCLDLVEKTQFFPLYYYEENKKATRSLFDSEFAEYTRREGITDFILALAQKQYGKTVSKEDIFYYVYGFLHSPDYRTKFANDLKKMLPRLPLADSPKDFWAFSKAGRTLAELHLNYETVPPCPKVKVSGEESKRYTVEKMKFLAKDRKDTIIYNDKIKIENIPTKAHEYIVNGKSAIEWILERYAVTTDKASGITNDPNDWTREHKKPRYILDLLLSVINVSVQTVDIVAKLPKVKWE
jgi:predicted helicase